MMPSPDPGASHGDTNERHDRTAPGSCHLACHCQLSAPAPRLTLCGVDADRDTFLHADHDGARHRPCVVCLDLARSVLVARRCERCPR